MGSPTPSPSSSTSALSSAYSSVMQPRSSTVAQIQCNRLSLEGRQIYIRPVPGIGAPALQTLSCSWRCLVPLASPVSVSRYPVSPWRRKSYGGDAVHLFQLSIFFFSLLFLKSFLVTRPKKSPSVGLGQTARHLLATERVGLRLCASDRVFPKTVSC